MQNELVGKWVNKWMRDQMPLDCLQKPMEWREYIFPYSQSTEIIRHNVFIKFLDLESGRLFEAGRLLNFQHFQQVKYVYFATKQ